MAGPLFANNVSTVLTVGIGPSDTLLQVAGAANMPAPTAGNYFYATLQDSAGFVEIVRVTARSGLTLTVARAQDTTTARTFSAGDVVEMRPNAQTMRDVDWRTQRGLANGIAPLDANSKVPTANLSVGIANGLASLGASSKVPLIQLPTDVPNGVPSLDSLGQIGISQLPARALTTVSTFASAAAMIAQSPNLQEGDLCVRSDTSETYARNTASSNSISDFTLLPAAGGGGGGGGVTSVNGATGVVVLTAAGLGAIPTTEKNAANGVAGLGANSRPAVAQLPLAERVTDASTSRSLTSADHGRQIQFTAGSAVSVSAPDTLPDGFFCVLYQSGAGQITVSASGAVTLRARKGAKSFAQFAPVGVSRVSSEVYVFGDTAV